MIRQFVGALCAVFALSACNAGSSGGQAELLQFSNGGRTGVAVTRSAGAALTLASAQRRSHGLGTLGAEARLQRAAQGHANWMAQNGQMSHTGANGSRMTTRLSSVGYKACFAAENVAFGQPNDDSVVRSWMGSSGHRRNILDGRATDGAVASATDGVGQTYWVMLVARPC